MKCFNGSKFDFKKFFIIGSIVLIVFTISISPFFISGEIKSLFNRLFPVQRGLSHSYWAANIWALYNFIDRLIYFILSKILKISIISEYSLTRGIVGDCNHVVLPSITTLYTFIFTILSMIPILIILIKKPTKQLFIHGLIYCSLCSFMLGYHVHEKAILMTLIPVALIAMENVKFMKLFFLLSIISTFSLFPLLFTSFEIITKIILFLLYHLIIYILLIDREKIKLNYIYTLYFTILAFIFVFDIFISFLFPSLPFLPLMLYSISCSVVNIYIWYRCLMNCVEL